MTYPKLTKMVQLLVKNTKSGLVDWQKTERPDAFQASFANYTVRVAQEESDHGTRVTYTLGIYDFVGDQIEETSDSQLFGMGGLGFSDVKEMYEIARRKVLGVEDALDQIIGELEGDMPF